MNEIKSRSVFRTIKELISHLNATLLVGLLLHLQLNCENFGLPSSLACSSCLGQGSQLAPLEHQFAPRELTQNQFRWGLLRLASLCRVNLLDLGDLLLGCNSLTCCRGLGGLLKYKGDALCFSTLE